MLDSILGRLFQTPLDTSDAEDDGSERDETAQVLFEFQRLQSATDSSNEILLTESTSIQTHFVEFLIGLQDVDWHQYRLELLHRVSYVTIREQQLLFEQDEDLNSIYFVFQGSIQIFR